MEHLLAGRLTDEDASRIRERFGLPGNLDITHQEAVVAAIAERAERGDKDCAAFLRDTAGQAPAAMVKLGNIDNRPFQTLDLSALSDYDLHRLAVQEQPDID